MVYAGAVAAIRLRPITDARDAVPVRARYRAGSPSLLSGGLPSDLGPARQDFLEDAVRHEVWPDIEQAQIHLAHAGQRGVAVLITIEATGAERSRISVRTANDWYRSRIEICIDRAFGAPGKS